MDLLKNFIYGVLVGVIIGASITSKINDAKWAEFRADAMEQRAEIVAKVADQEKAQSVKLADIAKGVHDAEQNINTRFIDLLRVSDGVREQGTTNHEYMPNDSAPAAAVPKEACRCNGKNEQAFKRFREDVLIIARDCDITTTYYNALLDIHNTAR